MSYQVLIFDVGTMMHVQWNFQPIVLKRPLLILCVYNSHTSLETPSTCTTSVLRMYFFLFQTQLSKLLQFKQQRLKQLSDMNTEVEKMVSSYLCVRMCCVCGMCVHYVHACACVLCFAKSAIFAPVCSK